jgi:hypothetical protein
MVAVLLLLAMMANPPTTTTVTPKSANAMSTNQPSGGDLIRAAQARHNRIFGAYVLILVLTVLGTYLVWSSGNKVQDAIQVDADARIAQAGQLSNQANALAQAARADAETARAEQEKLKNDSLKLAIRLQELEATNATAQQKIQKLEDEKKPRLISEDQGNRVIGLLRPFAGQDVPLEIYGETPEINTFATQVESILRAAGLKVGSANVVGGSAAGFGVIMHDAATAPPVAQSIVFAFRSVGIEIGALIRPDFGPTSSAGKFVVVIGEKITPPSN